MSARQIEIGRALQELEPEVIDLAIMARLVANYATEWISSDKPVVLAPDDAEALLFGILQLSGRARDLRKGYAVAFGRPPDD